MGGLAETPLFGGSLLSPGGPGGGLVQRSCGRYTVVLLSWLSPRLL